MASEGSIGCNPRECPVAQLATAQLELIRAQTELVRAKMAALGQTGRIGTNELDDTGFVAKPSSVDVDGLRDDAVLAGLYPEGPFGTNDFAVDPNDSDDTESAHDLRTQPFRYFEEKFAIITDNLAKDNRDDFIKSILESFRNILTQWLESGVASKDDMTRTLIHKTLQVSDAILRTKPESWSNNSLKLQFETLQQNLRDINSRIGCGECDLAMRPEGDAYVCESDGSTRYFDYEEGDGQSAVILSDDGPDGNGEDDGGRVPGAPRTLSAGSTGAQADADHTESQEAEAQEYLADIYNGLISNLASLRELRSAFWTNGNIGNTDDNYRSFVGGDYGLQAKAKSIMKGLEYLSTETDYGLVLDDQQRANFSQINAFNSDTESSAIIDSLDYIIGLAVDIVRGLETRSTYNKSSGKN